MEDIVDNSNSLIDQLKRVIEHHNKETNERVNNVSIRWHAAIGENGRIDRIEIIIEK